MDEKTRSEHSFESRRYLAKNGIYSTPAPFGHRNSGNFTLDIVPEEAAVVKQMFDWKTEDHYSYKLIASKLNAKGIKTKNNHRWVASSVEYVLHNPTYMGKIRYDKALYPGEHTPIISEEQFYKINSLSKVG